VAFAQQHDAVQGGVGLPVTTARETEALPCSGGCQYGCDAAEGCELSLGGDAFWVVAGSGEQVRGNERADTACGHESRVLTTGEEAELLGDMGDIGRQRGSGDHVGHREPFGRSLRPGEVWRIGYGPEPWNWVGWAHAING